MKNPILFRNFIIFSCILGACLVGLTYHIYISGQQIKVTDARVSHTQKVIRHTQEIISLITETISAQRKITVEKSNNKDSYNAEKDRLSTKIGELRELTQDNSVQNTRVKEIEHLSLRFKDRMDTKIEEFSAPESIPNMLDYEDIVSVRDDMFRLANTVLTEEYNLLDGREQEVAYTIRNYQASLLIGGVVACLIILIFNWSLLQALSKVNVAEDNMKESEERMRLAIRGSNDGIFDWNFKTHQIYWSAQYKKMLGYEDEEIRGNEDTFRTLLHPEDSETFWEHFNNYINGRLSEFSCIFRMIHKSGREVWIHGRGKALFDENGQAQRFIGAHTDISYIKEYERNLEEERDKAEAASKAKGDFLAHMSHEIRTPLTAVSGIAEILNQSPDSFNEMHKKLIKTLRTSTETLKELITDILDFSKIESGEIDLHIQKFTLGDLFEQVVSIMSVKASEKMLDFTIDYDDIKKTSFDGDKQRIRQILLNLVGNAIKFTEKGRVHVTARIEPVAESHILRIDIEDTGIGIPENALPIIFEKFRQADSSVSRRYGGTGLGLPISNSLATVMGGTIKVTSVVGKGSIFTVMLPFMTALADAEVDMGEVIKVQKLNDKLRALIGGKKKILLVEDYEGNIVVLSYILNELNCAYDVARTGLEAVQSWKEHHYDLILMDVQMPEMDGLTATRTIRKMEEEQGLDATPIIGLTAHALVADKQNCIDAGMNDYLSKPIVEADLKTAILRFFEPPAEAKKRSAS